MAPTPPDDVSLSGLTPQQQAFRDWILKANDGTQATMVHWESSNGRFYFVQRQKKLLAVGEPSVVSMAVSQLEQMFAQYLLAKYGIVVENVQQVGQFGLPAAGETS